MSIDERLIKLFLIEVREELSSMGNVDGFMLISSLLVLMEKRSKGKRKVQYCSVYCYRKRRD